MVPVPEINPSRLAHCASNHSFASVGKRKTRTATNIPSTRILNIRAMPNVASRSVNTAQEPKAGLLRRWNRGVAHRANLRRGRHRYHFAKVEEDIEWTGNSFPFRMQLASGNNIYNGDFSGTSDSNGSRCFSALKQNWHDFYLDYDAQNRRSSSRDFPPSRRPIFPIKVAMYFSDVNCTALTIERGFIFIRFRNP